MHVQVWGDENPKNHKNLQKNEVSDFLKRVVLPLPDTLPRPAGAGVLLFSTREFVVVFSLAQVPYSVLGRLLELSD